MSVLGLIYAASIALVITLFFTYALRMRGPWGNFWTFSLILFLAALIASLWIKPTGPSYLGIYWVPPLAVGVLVASILAAYTPLAKRNRERKRNTRDYGDQKSDAMAVGKFYWFLVVFMLVAIVMGLFTGL